MNIFQDLKTFEVVTTVDEKMSIICLPMGKYIFEDTQESFEIKNYSDQRMIPTDDLKNLRKMIDRPRLIIRYDHKENEKPSLLPEFVARIRQSYFDDEEYEYVYPSLEEEFAHRKSLEEIKENYVEIFSEPEYILGPVNYSIIGSFCETDSDFIHSPIANGKVRYVDDFIFRLDSGKVAKDELNKLVNELGESLFEIGSLSSGIRFVKYKSQYIFTSYEKEPGKQWINSTGHYILCVSLAQAKRTEKEIRQFVRNVIKSYDEPVFEEMSKGELVGELHEIKNALSRIRVLKSGDNQTEFFRARKTLEKLIEKLS
jgi:hypothetical protein